MIDNFNIYFQNYRSKVVGHDWLVVHDVLHCNVCVYVCVYTCVGVCVYVHTCVCAVTHDWLVAHHLIHSKPHFFLRPYVSYSFPVRDKRWSSHGPCTVSFLQVTLSDPLMQLD